MNQAGNNGNNFRFSKPIYILGKGKVASQLGLQVYQKGLNLKGMVVPTLPNRNENFDKFKDLPWIEWKNLIPQTNALWIVSVPDDQYTATLDYLKTIEDSIYGVVHTSGSISMRVFEPINKQKGVFYPLQTFSFERDIDWKNVPFCLEATSPLLLEDLIQLAKELDAPSALVDEIKRKNMHVAAVWACNFSNHMLAISELWCKEKQLPFNFLRPLMEETLTKAFTIPPSQAQTGPAVRKDVKTINAHLGLLQGHPDWKDLYSQISTSIQKLSDSL